jgi:hypothetical protein
MSSDGLLQIMETSGVYQGMLVKILCMQSAPPFLFLKKNIYEILHDLFIRCSILQLWKNANVVNNTAKQQGKNLIETLLKEQELALDFA